MIGMVEHVDSILMIGSSFQFTLPEKAHPQKAGGMLCAYSMMRCQFRVIWTSWEMGAMGSSGLGLQLQIKCKHRAINFKWTLRGQRINWARFLTGWLSHPWCFHQNFWLKLWMSWKVFVMKLHLISRAVKSPVLHEFFDETGICFAFWPT